MRETSGHNIVKSAIAASLPFVDRILYRSTRPVIPKLEGIYLLHDYDTALGFVVMNTAVYEGLKRANPAAKIIVACGPSSFDALQANRYVDALICLGDPTKSITASMLRLLRWRFFHYPRPDVSFLNCSIEKLSTDLLMVASGSAYRVGRGIFELYDRTTDWVTEYSVLENTMSRLASLGIRSPMGAPRIYFNRANVSHSERLFTENMESEAIRVVYVTQTSGGHPNRWWDDRFAKVADAINRQTGAPAIFLGTKTDVAPIERIRCQMKTQSVSLAGKTNLRELAALIAQSDLVITLDTGTFHVSEGTKTPSVVIAPAHQPRHEWLPASSNDIVILRRDQIPCRECRRFHCATRECMEQITPDQVIGAARTMIQKIGGNRRARGERVAESLSDHAPAFY